MDMYEIKQQAAPAASGRLLLKDLPGEYTLSIHISLQLFACYFILTVCFIKTADCTAVLLRYFMPHQG